MFGARFNNNNNKKNFLHLYCAFLGTKSALHSKGGISSSTTSVHHPPGLFESYANIEKPTCKGQALHVPFMTKDVYISPGSCHIMKDENLILQAAK